MARPSKLQPWNQPYPLALLLSDMPVEATKTVATVKEAFLALAVNSERFLSLRRGESSYTSSWCDSHVRVNTYDWKEAQNRPVEANFCTSGVIFLREESYSSGVCVVINWKIILQRYLLESATHPVFHVLMRYVQDFLTGQFGDASDLLQYVARYSIPSVAFRLERSVIDAEGDIHTYASKKLHAAFHSGSTNTLLVKALVDIFNVLFRRYTSNQEATEFPEGLRHWSDTCTIIDLTQLSTAKKYNPDRSSLLIPAKYAPRTHTKLNEVFTLAQYGEYPLGTVQQPGQIKGAFLRIKCGIAFFDTTDEPHLLKHLADQSRLMILHVPTVTNMRKHMNPQGYASFSLSTQNENAGYVLKDPAEIAKIIATPTLTKILADFKDPTAAQCLFVDLDTLARYVTNEQKIPRIITDITPTKKESSTAQTRAGRPLRSIETSTFTMTYPLSNVAYPVTVEFIFPVSSTMFRLVTPSIPAELGDGLLYIHAAYNTDVNVEFRGFKWRIGPTSRKQFGNTYVNKAGLVTLLQHPSINKHIIGWSPAWLHDFLIWLNTNTFYTKPPFNAVRDKVRAANKVQEVSERTAELFSAEADAYIQTMFRGQRSRLFDFDTAKTSLFRDIPIKFLFDRVEQHRNLLLERGEFNLNHLPHVCLTQAIKNLVDQKLYEAHTSKRITDEQYLLISEQNAKHRVYLDDKQLIKKLEKR